MALNLKKRSFKLSPALTGAIILGAGVLAIKTFPHFKASIKSLFRTPGEKEDEDDNAPVEVVESQQEILDESEARSISEIKSVEIAEWSDENLRSYLTEVRLINQSHDELY